MEFGKKRFIIDDKLLKQEVLKKNKKLEESNKKLTLSISNMKEELKSLSAEIESEKKGKDSILDSVRKDKEFSSLLKEKVNSLSQDKLVANNLVKEAKSEAKIFNRMTSDAERKLTAAENRIETLEKKGETFQGIYKKIKEAKAEFKEIESQNLAAKKAIEDMKSEWESDHNSKENEFERLRETLTKNMEILTKSVADLNDEKCMLEHEIEILINKSQKEKERFNTEVSKNTEEISHIHLKGMIQVKQEIDKLKHLSSETAKKSKELEDENNKLDKVKDNHIKAVNKFDQWKINSLDEVARLKNKGKIDNIDKAGLSDVLNK